MSKKTNYLFVGLGNPGLEYEQSRHSFGRMVLLALVQKPGDELEVSDWEFDKKAKAQIAKGSLGKNKFRFVLPENFMNNSGGVVKSFVKIKSEAKTVVVLHDDVDLPLGTIKISYNRGSGGHKGVESIVKALKTSEFIRLRLGISPSTMAGKTKKPSSEKVIDFVIGNFKPAEIETLKKTIKLAKKVVISMVDEGYEKAMNLYN